MKKLVVIGLMMFITLVFTGCSNATPPGDIIAVTTNAEGIQLTYTNGDGYWIDKEDIKEGDKAINMKKAIETYGDNYQVVELSKSDFLIVWDKAQLIFNNNECVGYVGLY